MSSSDQDKNGVGDEAGEPKDRRRRQRQLAGDTLATCPDTARAAYRGEGQSVDQAGTVGVVRDEGLSEASNRCDTGLRVALPAV